MRRREFPMLQGPTYLDHAGTALASKSLMIQFSKEMSTRLLANPHSAGAKPNGSQLMISATRLKVLQLFRADPELFDIVFVANATAGIKLVVEAFSGVSNGFDYVYHRDSHTSLVGIRELAENSRCFETDEEAVKWLEVDNASSNGDPNVNLTLFAYPAQSNMNGRRLPFHWPRTLRSNPHHPKAYCLLDAAALVSTSPLDLSDYDCAPDFVVLSFYKMFGFPDLGALIVRKPAGELFANKRYFGGGTTEMITCFNKPWFQRKEEIKGLNARLEDGTLAIRSILALGCAIDVQDELFGGYEEISKHTGWLASCMYDQLSAMKHANGVHLCKIYKDPTSTYGDPETQGATVAFNICRSDGTWVASSTVGRLATESNIHIRTGGVCNPAGTALALNLTDDDIQRAYTSGFRCGQENDVRDGMPMGIVRASFGPASTLKDVDVFVNFVRESFQETGAAKVAIGADEENEFAISSICRKDDRKGRNKPSRVQKRRWHRFGLSCLFS
ncbi:PLP-dependent transferase [Lojkania enalia]|uniref:PLP-dependent transferase n=1 Tax=Lojkania enalia TaxID=147567 RepID=A0A9P4N6P6_9PLEO|nr:PLP-dependent transferase [Didymosphaeria enalia]